MKKIALMTILALAAGGAWAEKADSLQPMQVTYSTLDVDDVTQTKTLTGNVILTRGTIIMNAEKAVVKEDAEGYQYVTLTGAPGQLATFRQKRDGGPDLWVEGQAERIEYNDKVDLIKLFSKAKLRQLEGQRMTNEIESEFISYDSRKEFFMVRNDASGENVAGKGRGTLIIESRTQKASAPAPAAGKAATPAAASVPPATPGK